MSEELRFKLIEEKVPQTKKGAKGSKYDKLLDEFASSEMASVRVTVEGMKYGTLLNGLKQRVKNRQLKGVLVHSRSGKVYLSRE